MKIGEYNFTKYVSKILEERTYIKLEWIEETIQHPKVKNRNVSAGDQFHQAYFRVRIFMDSDLE